MNTSQNRTRLIVIIAILIIAGLGLGYSLMQKKPSASAASAVAQQTPNGQQVATQSTAVQPTAAASTYKDGTYSATGSYISPGGDEKIGVTLTLKDDLITAASVTPEPVSSEGAHFQGLFAQGFQQYVVGKDISAVHLTQVSGSSLTPGGFDDALTQIEAEARA